MNLRVVTLLCMVVVLSYAAVFAKGWGAPKGWIVNDKGEAQQTDYLSLWAAGRLALEGKAADAYEWGRHEQAMGVPLGKEPPDMLPYAYPPTFFPLIALFAKLPYLPSMLMWSILALIPFAAANARIIGRPEAALWMCATVPAFWNFAVGQTGALLAALLGGGLALMGTRPVLAGVALGAMSVKPHLAALVPVALIAGRQWQTLIAAGVTAVVLAALSLVMFGIEPWLAYLPAASKFGSFVLSEANQDAHKLQSIYGVAVTLGLPIKLALGLQISLAAALAALIFVVWQRPGNRDLKCGVVMCAAAMVSPYLFHYDLILLSIAQAFLIRHALEKGFATNDLIVVLVPNVLVTMTIPMHFPTGFLASAMLLGVMLQRLGQAHEDVKAPEARAT